MTKRIVVVALLTVLLTVSTWGQRKVGELEVTLNKNRYVLYETVSGLVTNLAPGENFTVEFTDGHGRTLIRKRLRRAGARPTPFSFRIDFSPTIYYTVNVLTTKERKTSVPLLVTSTEPIWDDFPMFIWQDSSARSGFYFGATRLLGINGGFVGPKSKAEDFLRNDFRCLVTDAMGEKAFQTSGERAPADPAKAGTPVRPVRTPCLSDPEVSAGWFKAFDDLIKKHRDSLPVGYSIGDELSVTQGTDATDICFDPRTLEAFRTALRVKYKTIGALNRVWGTKFRRWSDVVPMTAEETIKSQFGVAPLRRKPYNFASWYDHRVFMDGVFISALEGFVTHAHDVARQQQTEVRIGMTGAFEPAAYGGYDWSGLINVFDWFECPDRFGSKRLVNALNHRRRVPAVTLAVVNDRMAPKEAARKLWRDILVGDDGVIFKSGAGVIDGQDRLTEFAYGMAWQIRTLRDGLGRLLAHPRMLPVDDGVAIYTSQPSVRVQWMLDAGSSDGSDYLGRSVTDADSTGIAGMLGWMELLDDLHVGYTFVSHRAVVEDARALTGVSVLVLPRTVCMSPQEVTRLNNWVRAGGTLIADSQTAVFDEHARQLAKGQLDSLFGIRRGGLGTSEVAGQVVPITKMPLRLKTSGALKNITKGLSTEGLVPVEPAVEGQAAKALLQSGRVNAIFVRKLGKGNAIYLNLSLLVYHRNRHDSAKVVGLKQLVTGLLSHVGLKPTVVVKAVEGSGLRPDMIEVFRNASGSIEVVALMRRTTGVVAPAPVEAAGKDVEEIGKAIDGAPEPVEAPVEPAPAPQPVKEKADPEPAPQDEKPEAIPVPRAKVMLPRKCHAYDMLRRVYLGNRQEVEVALPDDTPALIACLPYEVRRVKSDLKLTGRRLRYQFSVDALPTGRVGTHVFHVEVRDPKDRSSFIHSFNVTAKSGFASGTLHFALSDEAGTWKLIVTDVVSGKSAEATVELK